MIRVARIAPGQLRHGSSIVVIETAADASRFRPGDIFWTGPSTDSDLRRLGDHRVKHVDVESGVVVAEAPIHATSPTACDGDWIFVADRPPQWSPYP